MIIYQVLAKQMNFKLILLIIYTNKQLILENLKLIFKIYFDNNNYKKKKQLFAHNLTAFLRNQNNFKENNNQNL